MNDPGLDQPISEEAKDIENQTKDERDEEQEEEEAFLEPSRWWFASTAFPLIAGTFGPMASAFSICALVVHWRVYLPPNTTDEETGVAIDDPKWLVGINAAQLAMALISNFTLLLNMARRLRFSIAQPITIIGWYISSFALLGLCACASGPLLLQPTSTHAFTGAFYYAIFSSALYFLVATLMLITVIGAWKGHYNKEFKLTMSQQTLMLQTISFLIYLLAGAAVYSHIENWAYLDAVYWADFTLLTVGTGDFSPSTHLGRSLLFPFAIGGIIILGLVIGSIRSLVLERGKLKMGARIIEKQRQHLLKKIAKSAPSSAVLQPISTRPSTQNSNSQLQKQTSKDEENKEDPRTERQRRRLEFHLMRQIQARAQTRRRWTSLLISGSTWLSLWFLGALVFRYTEEPQQWSYFTSLYFAYTSLLTIGYGDIYPKSNSGKAFFVFWSLLAVPSLTILISNMGDTIVKVVRNLTLWVGRLTILPGEKDIKSTLKEGAHRATRGHLFDSDIQETPPGFLGEAGPHNSEEDSESGPRMHNRKNDPESAAQRVEGDKANMEIRHAKDRGRNNDELPKSKREYHLLLIKEISKVTKHLNSFPPRKYTFNEWAFFLKLIGEDEDDGDRHMDAKKGLGEEEVNKMGVGRGEGEKWSWVGERSPLMGNTEEAEWILERLIGCLGRELEEGRRMEVERSASLKREKIEDELRGTSSGRGKGNE